MSELKPVLDQINIVASDVDACAAFYRELGVDLPKLFTDKSGNGFHAEGKASEDVLLEVDSEAFAKMWNESWAAQKSLSGRLVLGFRLVERAHVDQLHAKMVGIGYRCLQAPFDAFWGARYAIIEDPSGVAVGLMSQAADEYRSALPDL